MEPNKENTLYLTIKQVYFDQIIAGTKKEEYREIKGTTYKRYLEVDEEGNPYFDDELISDEDPLVGDLCVYNDGKYPYYPKDGIKYLALAVGYAKERDTATVEVKSMSFEPLKAKDEKFIRFTWDDNDEASLDDNGELCFWNIVFHLGDVVKLKRK